MRCALAALTAAAAVTLTASPAAAGPAVTSAYACEQVSGSQNGYEHEQVCVLDATIYGPARGWTVTIRAPRGEVLDVEYQQVIIPDGQQNSALGADFADGITAPFVLRGGRIPAGWKAVPWYAVELPAADPPPQLTIRVLAARH